MQQVQRYIRLTNLIPELLKKLDKGKLSFNPAVELSYLTEDEQKMMLQTMEFTQALPSLSQAQRIKKLSQEEKATIEETKDILSEVKKGEVHRVSFKIEQLHKYFPTYYTVPMMKREILSLLTLWVKEYKEK